MFTIRVIADSRTIFCLQIWMLEGRLSVRYADNSEGCETLEGQLKAFLAEFGRMGSFESGRFDVST